MNPFGIHIPENLIIVASLCLFMVLSCTGTRFVRSLVVSAAFGVGLYAVPCITVLTAGAALWIITHRGVPSSVSTPIKEYSDSYIRGATVTQLNRHEVLIEKDGKQVILGSEEHFYPATGHGKYYVREAGSTEHERNKLYVAANAGQFGMTQEQAAAEIVRKKLK